MKVVILGDGMLGSELVEQTNWDYLSRKKDGIDFTNLLSFSNKLSEFDTIVNCIAYTKTYSDDKELHWDVNVKSLDKLIDYCNDNNKKLIHISTDYIYAGSVTEATEEDVPVHLPTWYGYTKLFGDGLIQLRCNNYLLCRLSHKPFPFPYNDAWLNVKTNCDYTPKIANLVIQLVNNNCSGVFNVGTKTKSIYELASRTKKVNPILRPENVPNDTSMNLNKLYEELNIAKDIYIN